MSHSIQVAAIQMNANPAPTRERLARATQLVENASQAGAQLILLPEIFNTGYTYDQTNWGRAESFDGTTVAWLRTTAARLKIHLAGSLMLLDGNEIYNALLLFAPDGRYWRYDKNYPWGWERAYFRERQGITVAQTDLGDIGMLICWDSAHRDLWAQYAGKVDLMLVSSCPPDATNPTFHLPNGDHLTFAKMGPLMASIKDTAKNVFGRMINEQTAWLGVPTVATVGIGTIRTKLPASLRTFLTFLPTAPHLIKYLPYANQLEMTCQLVPGCKVVSANGQIISQIAPEQGESFTIATIELTGKKNKPTHTQPPAPIPQLNYLISDYLLPNLVAPTYKRGVRSVWGSHMAPAPKMPPSSIIWIGILGILVGLWGNRLWSKRKH